MKLTDSDLLAYVDDRLSADERRRVESALRHDLAAQAKVCRLSAVSAEEIKSALGGDGAEPIPFSLAQTIGKGPDQKSPGGRWASPWMAIAASLATLVVGGAGGYIIADKPPVVAEASKDWITRVAEYQSLYVRDTVATARLSPDQRVQLEARLSDRLGRTIAPPDLGSFGLTFKRGQLLDIDGNAVAQLVYLPADGEPIALCVVRTALDDLSPAEGRAEGLNYSHWRDRGYAFVLIGDAAPARIQAMAEDARQQLRS